MVVIQKILLLYVRWILRSKPAFPGAAPGP